MKNTSKSAGGPDENGRSESAIAASWEVLKSGGGGGRTAAALRRPPRLRWGGQKPIGYLNTSATAAIREIIGGPGDAGIIIRRGTGDDEGMFALEVIPYPAQKNPLVLKLTALPKSSAMSFSCGGLCSIVPAGESVLTAHGKFLVGELKARKVSSRSKRSKS